MGLGGHGWDGVAMTRAFPPPQIRCNSVPGIRATTRQRWISINEPTEIRLGTGLSACPS